MGLRHVGPLLITASVGLFLGSGGCDDETTATPAGTTSSGSTTTGSPSGQGGSGGIGGAATGQGGSSQGGGGAGQGGTGGSGGCLTCHQVWLQQGDPAELCTDGTPSSADLHDDLQTCACAACDADCGDNFCNDLPPTTECGACAVPACGPQVSACYNDQ